nr:uncharacterized protein LOC107445215 [Parasteatoda tepidariorum]
MNAKNREKETLMTCAIRKDSPRVEQLKRIFFYDTENLSSLSDYFASKEQYDIALNLQTNLLEKKRKILGSENPDTLETEESVAWILYKQQRYKEALSICKEILNKREDMLGKNNKYTHKSLSSIALILHRLGRNLEAIDIFENVHKKQKEILGLNNSDTLQTAMHMALVLNDLDRHEEALNINKSVFRECLKLYGFRQPITLASQNNIGQTLTCLKNYDEAIRIYKVVYNLRKEILGPFHSDTLRTFRNLNQVLGFQNKSEEALKGFQEVLRLQKVALGHNHIDTIYTEFQIASLLLREGRHIEAYEILKENIEKFKTVLGANHPLVLETESILDSIKYLFEMDGFQGMFLLNKLDNKYKPHTLLSSEFLAKDTFQFVGVDSEDGNSTKMECLSIEPDVINSLVGKNNSNSASLSKHFLTRDLFQHENVDLEGKNSGNICSSNTETETINQCVNEKDKYRALYSEEFPIEMASPLIVDSEGRTPLHYAVSKGEIFFVKHLLHCGHDTMHVTNKGNTVVHIASLKGFTDIIEVLLTTAKEKHFRSFHKFINAKTHNGGNTALHAAANLETVLTLLKYGVVYDEKNNVGKIPQDHTDIKEITSFLQLVSGFFTDASTGDTKMISKLKKLLEKEKLAIVNARNGQNLTLLQVSLKNGYKEIANELCSIMKD